MLGCASTSRTVPHKMGVGFLAVLAFLAFLEFFARCFLEGIGFRKMCECVALPFVWVQLVGGSKSKLNVGCK